MDDSKGTQPPDPGVSGIGSIADKRRVLEWLKNSDKKFRRPLETGDLNAANFLGGSWNDYAQVVFSMMLLDTLVNVEEQLRIMNGTAESPVEVQVLDSNKAAIGIGRRHGRNAEGETVVLVDKSVYKRAAYAREMDGQPIAEDIVFSQRK